MSVRTVKNSVREVLDLADRILSHKFRPELLLDTNSNELSVVGLWALENKPKELEEYMAGSSLPEHDVYTLFAEHLGIPENSALFQFYLCNIPIYLGHVKLDISKTASLAEYTIQLKRLLAAVNSSHVYKLLKK